MTNYNKQAKDFLHKTNSTIEKYFVRYDYYFEGDKEKRDIYNITIKRGERQISFTFGQSIVNSSKLIISNSYSYNFIDNDKKIEELRKNLCDEVLTKKNLKSYQLACVVNFPKKPTDYDILACVEKYDPETFEFFCGNYGYDQDSRKAEKIYKAVKQQFLDIQLLFNDEELEILREIN